MLNCTYIKHMYPKLWYSIIKTYVFRSHVKYIFLQLYWLTNFNHMSKRNLKALYKGCVNINRKIIIQLD